MELWNYGTMETYPIYTILHMGLIQTGSSRESVLLHVKDKTKPVQYIQRSHCTKRSRLGGLLFVKVASQNTQLEEKRP